METRMCRLSFEELIKNPTLTGANIKKRSTAMNTKTSLRNAVGIAVVAGLVVGLLPASNAQAQACNKAAAPAGGTLDPCAVPKYVLPLVIPPVMDNSGEPNDYDIAVRQFQQQILPGGIWNTVNGRADAFPATTVW